LRLVAQLVQRNDDHGRRALSVWPLRRLACSSVLCLVIAGRKRLLVICLLDGLDVLIARGRVVGLLRLRRSSFVRLLLLL
jgi:hypothetical protein